MKKRCITFENVSVRLGSALIVREVNWEMRRGEHWAILGPNGSGKSTMVRALFGGAAVARGRIIFHFEKDEAKRGHPALMKDKIGYVSFELHQKLMEQEDMQQSLREYKGTIGEEYTSAREVVMSGVAHNTTPRRSFVRRVKAVAKQLGITALLSRNITALSTGEMRKTLIARALMKEPKLLILDEPFDGLDEGARASLKKMIDTIAKDVQVILITHRTDEIPSCISHALLLHNGAIVTQGKKDVVITEENIAKLFEGEGEDERIFDRRKTARSLKKAARKHTPLIAMNNVSVKYGKTVALDRLTWEMQQYEHWAILGPNGSGKSTIVKLIMGEHGQGYANKIMLFGRRRGTGETLWEIKKRIGVVSGELQVQYRKSMRAFDVVASGFYDSIGLYQYPTHEEMGAVQDWANKLTIAPLLEKNFHELSYGQRRMALIARAMVKAPTLLILDEPCHGLDARNRQRVLAIIQYIGTHTDTTLLFVTHHHEEIVPCIAHVLKLKKGKRIV